ncbi:MAG: NAD-dependent protein deacetylase [Dokdonella sp.]
MREFAERYPRLFVLTGAGCSTGSGIPDYRDVQGAWKRTPPITLQVFLAQPLQRARYWARSMIGWRRFGSSSPNAGHHALAELEQRGCIEGILTQNVDGLHQAAGSHAVIDLHGRLDTIRCMACEARTPRGDFQQRLVVANPSWAMLDAAIAPDGDADLEHTDFSDFVIPSCEQCGGMVKPDVVFFGENVPRQRVEAAMSWLANSDAMLVVGSSLMVYSGYRFAVEAKRLGKPIAAINRGVTRADELLDLKIDADCATTLASQLD